MFAGPCAAAQGLFLSMKPSQYALWRGFYLSAAKNYLLRGTYLQLPKFLYTVIISTCCRRYGTGTADEALVHRGIYMRVKIEIVEGQEEEEVVIRCGALNDSVISLQDYLSKQNSGKRCLSLADGGTDFFIPMEDIYFFETEGRELRAHTADRIFTCGYKLYELEEMLPGSFMRISKSTIANLDYIYSITRNLTASSIVEFKGSRKKAMVSRSYYKLLLERLNTRRTGR